MGPVGHRWQVLLFLGAILVPSLVLVALSLRMIGQEQELAERRREVERRRLVEQLRKDLLVRLEQIKIEELGALAQPGEPARPPGYRNPAVALAGRVENNKLVLPWERDAAALRFRELAAQAPFGPKIRQGEQQEFVAGRTESAVSSYEEAMRLARHPAQEAYARLLRARALDKLGRRREALADFQKLLALPPEMIDEDGVPLKLYAAERLLQTGPEIKGVLHAMEQAAKAQGSLPPAGCYVLSGVTEKLMRVAGDPRDREAAAGVHRKLRDRIRQIQQAEALQQDLPRLKPAPDTWIPYGEETWLVSTAAAGWPPALIAVRARDIFSALEASWDSPFWRNPQFVTEGTGELLGDTFPGLKVSLGAGEDGALPRAGLQQWLFYVTLALVVAATMFGAYLLWRDLRRELRLADVRSRFVSGVSHELKTPLTAIRMFAETLQMGRSQDPRVQAEYLDTIVSECERLSRLVDDVLSFSKIEQGKKTYRFRPMHLAEVVQSAARTLRHSLAQQGFQLRVEAADGLPPLAADRDALEQAILNLLSNAMKYSGDSRVVELELKQAGGEALIRVTDHGVGIAPEHQPRIFEKFYRAPTRENQLVPGTGLGLTLVEQTAKAHGGRVEVESAPGAGSTFTIRLPLENQHERHPGD
ncbi:MAG: HAMP domain-containing sensor histidine kinase [Acidobacteriota bacterium]